MRQKPYFNALRTEYYLGGRMLFLHDQLWTGAIQFGYAIESFFKETLLFLGNRNQELQYSHDLSLLLNSCQQKGAFNDLEVPDDFIEYSNSLFQMRYPSSGIKETLKAYDRNNVIAVEKSYLFCYDDYIQQLDESLFKITNDPYSSTILRIFAGVNKKEKQYGLYFNSTALKRFDTYKERVSLYFSPNKEANETLKNNDAIFFWTDGYDYKIYADLNYYSNNRDLLKFKFPGKVHRDSNGVITKLEF